MVESELNECQGDAGDVMRQRQAVLDSYFATEDSAPTPGMFADPAMMFGSVTVKT